jgi:hypothetical protein
MMAAPAAWLTELGFAGQAAAFKCDVSRRPGRSDGGCGSSLGRSPLAGRERHGWSRIVNLLAVDLDK